MLTVETADQQFEHPADRLVFGMRLLRIGESLGAENTRDRRVFDGDICQNCWMSTVIPVTVPCNNQSTALVDAYRSRGHTLQDIGQHFGLHYSTVSGIIRNHKPKSCSEDRNKGNVW